MNPSTHYAQSRTHGRDLVANERCLFLMLLGLLVAGWSFMAIALGPTTAQLAGAPLTTSVAPHSYVACENASTRGPGELLRCRLVAPEDRLQDI